MIVTRLKLANLRAIEAAKFRFQPGINLIVGVNGVGKTSILDAVLSWWWQQEKVRRGAVPRGRVERERERMILGAGELEPYCQVAVWWLERFERRAA